MTCNLFIYSRYDLLTTQKVLKLMHVLHSHNVVHIKKMRNKHNAQQQFDWITINRNRISKKVQKPISNCDWIIFFQRKK